MVGVAIAALVVAQPSSEALAIDDPSECRSLLVWDYKEDRAVASYQVVRACRRGRLGRIHIEGFLERCDLQGDCVRVEKKRTCRRAKSRVRWEIPHSAIEVGRYRATIEHRATKPRDTGSGSLDWICYSIPGDKDCVG